MKARFLPIALMMHPLLLSGQILTFQFNEGAGTTAASTGIVTDPLTLRNTDGTPTTGLWGSPGSGPSGVENDLALNLAGADGMGSGFSGPNASLTALSSLAILQEFTITGWFRTLTSDLGRASLLYLQCGVGHLSITGLSGGPSEARNRLRLIVDPAGNSFPAIDALGAFESLWSSPNEWAFFAISYSGVETSFYSGSIALPSSLSATSPAASVQVPLSGASLWLGTRPGHENPLKGSLDDVRLYGTALSPAQIEQVRASALNQRISVEPIAGGQLKLTWIPAPHLGLQTSSNLNGSGWHSFPDTEGKGSATVAVGVGPIFFRLVQH